MGAIYHAGVVYGGSMVIDDVATASDKSWSSNKINNQINEQKPLMLTLNFTTSSRSVGSLSVTQDMAVTGFAITSGVANVTSSMIGFSVTDGTIALSNSTTITGNITVNVFVEHVRTS